MEALSKAVRSSTGKDDDFKGHALSAEVAFLPVATSI